MRSRPGRSALVISFIVSVFVLAACATSPSRPLQAAPGPPIAAVRIGDTATYPAPGLVSVRNLETLEAKSGTFNFDDECLALDGGQVTALGVHAGRVLIRYEPPKMKLYGSCPKGTLFFVTEAEFSTMSERYQCYRSELEAERELVKRLLEDLGKSP